MIIILIIVVTFARLKQEITCHHFKDGAGQAPNVSRSIIIGTYNDLWRTILSRLNFRSEMVICPASISHVAYLYHYILINLGTSLTLALVRLLLLLSTCRCIIELIILVEQ
jgi:hypothetical protein